MNTMNHTISNVTIDQIFADVEELSMCLTKAEKVAIASKYGIESVKVAEITNALYKMANDLHHGKTEFDRNDYLAFMRFWNAPESAAKIRMATANESIEFVTFVRDTIATGRKYYGRESVIGAYDRIIAERRAACDTDRQDLTKRIEDQIVDFKADFFQRKETFAMNHFNRLNAEYGTVELSYKGVIAFFGDQGWEKNEKNYKKIANIRRITNDFDLDAFLADAKRDAEDEWKTSINLVVTRILSAGMDRDKIQIRRISDLDAKAFDIYITDGTRSMHARSIYAAECSTIVSPHFRFIITNC